jgi:hypothetical protein
MSSDLNQDVDHNSVQINAITGLNEVRRTIPTLALIYLIWNVVEIVIISVVLGLTWDKPCDEPTIRIIAISRLVRNAMMVFVHFRRVIGIPETDLDNRLQGLNRLAILFFFIFSQQWLSSADTESRQCLKDAPMLYYTGIGIIVLLYLTMLAPILLVLLICFCLPCVLTVFRFLNIGDVLTTSASESDVQQIPTFTYDPTTYVNPFDHTQPQPPHIDEADHKDDQHTRLTPAQQPHYTPRHDGKSPSILHTQPTAPQLSPSKATKEVAVSVPPSGPPPPPPQTESPECPICLCEFERGEEMKQLKCLHAFHTPCIADWLKINRTCPVCRKDAITGVPQDITQSRRTLNQFF